VFEAWTNSEAAEPHLVGQGTTKPLYVDHPQLQGFDVTRSGAARRRWRDREKRGVPGAGTY
jgi:hypothetical protein